jgi:hypothetical protein
MFFVEKLSGSNKFLSEAYNFLAHTFRLTNTRKGLVAATPRSRKAKLALEEIKYSLNIVHFIK